MNMTALDDFHKQDWIRIPNTTYIMKYVFANTGYNMVISNLIFMYSEKLADSSVLERFQKLNPFAQMKLQVILENLRKALQKCLTENTELNLRLDSDKLIIVLQFPAAHILCNYEIEMTIMGPEKITQFIICPIMSSALLSQKKAVELESKIKSLESSAKSSLFIYTSSDSLKAIEPDLLYGENVPTETIIDSFLKVQSNLKDLIADNQKAYSALGEEKLKEFSFPNKKYEHRENCSDESANIKFDDGDEISVRKSQEERTMETDANYFQSVKKEAKKRKHFKI